MKFWPRQDIPENEKTPKWYCEHLDFAQQRHLNSRTPRVRRMTKVLGYYNGYVPDTHIKYISHTYGKANIGKFVTYGIGKVKINRLNGEFIDMPQNSTVVTINPEAKAEKMNNYHIQIGLREAGPEVTKLREVVGADPYDGMPIPEKTEDDMLDHMSFKSMNEHIMQLAVSYQYKNEDLKTKFASNFLDLKMWSEAYGKVEINSNGDTTYREIDPRNALFEETDRDPFLKRSPYLGEVRMMYVHDILMEFPELSKEQRNKIEQIKGNYEALNRDHPELYKMVDNGFAIGVYTIEWKTVEPILTKISPDKKNIKSPYKKSLNPDVYFKDKENIDKEIEKDGGFIETKYKTSILEATRIGHDLDIRCQRKPFQPRQFSKPGETMYGYTGVMLPTRDGIRTSLWEMIQNLSFLYDVIMFQVNRELAKAKGMTVKYDMAYMPKDKTMADILYDIANNSIYLMDSSQDGNKNQREVSVNGELKAIDLGISSIIQTLLPLKAEIKATMDQITGMNDAREGNLAASTTATNGESQLQASRLSTKGLFYYINRYCENVLTLICEHTKISWGVLNKDRAKMIIGEAGVKYLSATRDLTNDDYAAFIQDGFKEMKVRDTINRLAEASLNSQQIRIQDVMGVELAETMSQAEAKLKKGWEQLQIAQQKSSELQAETAKAAQENARQMALEDREDRQAHEIQIELIRAKGESAAQTQRDANEVVKQQAQAELADDSDTSKVMMGYKKGKK